MEITIKVVDSEFVEIKLLLNGQTIWHQALVHHTAIQQTYQTLYEMQKAGEVKP